MHLEKRTSAGGMVQQMDRGWRLEIPPGEADAYRLAQLDNYAGMSRRRFPLQPPIEISARARISGMPITGTLGFGLWNDPFGLGIAQGGEPLRLPALPQAAWIFGASERNSLAVHDGMPENGFYAQVMQSPRFSLRLAEVGLGILINRKRARQALGKIIAEAGATIRSDPAEFHVYRIQWTEAGAAFWVDEKEILRTSVSPRGPLGLVLWVDNQYARFDLQKRPGWGLEPNRVPAWLEIEDLAVTPISAGA
jgi:hypothetical protein